jgi:hypothetical protein
MGHEATEAAMPAAKLQTIRGVIIWQSPRYDVWQSRC